MGLAAFKWIWRFPIVGGSFLGLPTRRIIVFLGVYEGTSIFGKVESIWLSMGPFLWVWIWFGSSWDLPPVLRTAIHLGPLMACERSFPGTGQH